MLTPTEGWTDDHASFCPALTFQELLWPDGGTTVEAAADPHHGLRR